MRAEIFRHSEINLRIPEDLGVHDSDFFSFFGAGLRSSEVVGLVLQESEAFR